jgi:hypothetical protein
MLSIGTYLNRIIDSHYAKPADKIGLPQALVLMIPLPIVCMIFALIIVQHHIVIGQIGSFLRHEIELRIPGKFALRHWDNSASLKKKRAAFSCPTAFCSSHSFDCAISV